MKRRQVLRSAGGLGIGLTAGCLSNDREEYATMQELGFMNRHSDPISAELRIERTDTDEVVHTETRELTVDPELTILDCVWPDAPVTVMVRPEDGEWNSFDTKGKDGCVGVIADVGEQSVSFLRHKDECPIANPSCHTD